MNEQAPTKPPVMRSLLWKDARSLQSLILAIWFGILFFNVMAYLISTWINADIDIFVCVWLLMPNLVALGAPSMLVGVEEESGTLDWLRTLPIADNRVVDSKFLVALAAVLATWLLASGVMLLVYLGWSASPSSLSAFAWDMLSPVGIAKSLLFTCTLLLVGFVTSYTIRSPIGALVALLPLITVVQQSMYLAGVWIITGRLTMVITTARDDSGSRRLLAGILAIALLLALWWLQRFLGRRRMNAPAKSRVVADKIDVSASAYRPPVAAGLQRPGKMAALLWQQARQVAFPACTLTLIALLFVLANFVLSPLRRGVPLIEFAVVFAFPVVILAMSWVGSLVFYGDSLRRRCNFFADRGISPTRIWWTRVLYPGLCCLLLAVMALGIPNPGRMGELTQHLWVFIIVAFAFGQFVAQWVSRPILAFFAGPAYMMIISLALFFVYSYYPAYQSTYAFVALVLLLATWRMTGRWLEDRINAGFHWRMVAYTALAIAIPLVVIVADRVITTPALRPDWRAKAMAASDSFYRGTVSQRSIAISTDGVSVSAHWPYYSPVPDGHIAIENTIDHQVIAQNLLAELNSDVIAESTSAYDILMILNRNYPRGDLNRAEVAELKRNAVAVLLRWSQLIRERVIAGELPLYFLERTAEPAEAFAVQVLGNRPGTLGGDGDIKKLVDAIPSQQLRFQSRKQALLSEWRRYQDDDWVNTDNRGHRSYRKHYMGHLLGYDAGFLPFERHRSDRFVDQATRVSWDQLENGLPAIQSSEYLRRGALFNNIFHPRQPWAYRNRSPVGMFWTSDHEKAVGELRGRYASGRNEE